MLQLGVIGTGWITEAFLQAALKTGKYRCYAVYSRSTEKADAFVRRFTADAIYTDLDQMAEDSRLDVVYIASPNALHFEQACAFLKKGKHVICEKPIFSNTKELKQAFTLAEGAGAYLFEAVRHIHAPSFKILKQNLPQIGVLRGATFHFLQFSSRYDRFLKGDVANVFSLKYSGGALVDLGVYAIYTAVGLFGKPVKVAYYPVMLSTGVDGAGTLILQYKNFVCTIVCSKITHSFLPGEIHGEDGTLRFDHLAPIRKIELLNSRTKEEKLLPLNQDEQDMQYEANVFAEIIKKNDRTYYEKLCEDCRTVLEITEEARKQNGILFPGEEEL